MAFEILTVEKRAERMRTWFTGICSSITDFVVGSKIRSKFETVAVEMEAQDLAFFRAARKAIQAGLYAAFGFSPIESITATGTVLFSIDSASNAVIEIPAGTIVGTSVDSGEEERTFTTTGAVTIPIGDKSVTANIICTVAGAFGNVKSNAITQIKTTANSALSVTNILPIESGKDAESADARCDRFQKYIPTLRRGTESSIVYAAKTAKVTDEMTGQDTSVVVSAKVIQASTPGLIDLYIYDGKGDTVGASSTLILNTKAVIDGYYTSNGVAVPGYKAAGVVCNVKAVTTKKVTVAIEATAYTDTAVPAIELAINENITAYVTSLDIGEQVILSAIIERVQSIEGIYKTTVIAPTTDIAILPNEIAVIGTITVNILQTMRT